ncbi:MAG: hypothetical protein N4A38_03525 [Candidatus Gracilibacteria bacterium]|nr:hypothetical protein [Candidatus Gracilibacteria bacterium]
MFSLKKLLPNKKIAIISIGNSKVRVAICEQDEKSIKLLAISEKRQEQKDFLHGEITDIEGVCETIDSALSKASKLAPVTIGEAILNVPSSSVIGEINKINYQRKQPDTNIDLEELDTIIGKIEHFSIKKAQKKIYETSGYKNLDIKLITSSITQISIDNDLVKNPIGFSGKNVTISVLNIFTPISKYNIIKSIGKYLSKKIDYIIPKEFALGKIIEKSSFNSENVSILDIGYSKTRIIIQKGGNIIGFKIIDIGILDLIKQIKKDTKENEIEIQKNLNSERYFSHKRQFLNVWGLGLSIAIKELINDSYFPEKVFLAGLKDFDFINSFLKSSKFSAIIKTGKQINFINDEIEKELEKILKTNNIFAQEINPKNIDYSLLSLILSYSEIINIKEDAIAQTLKNVLNKIKL